MRVKVSWGHSASTPIPAGQQQQLQQQHHQPQQPAQMQVGMRVGAPMMAPFRPPPPQYYDPLKYMTLEESDERVFLEMERVLELSELCNEDEPRNILFAN